MKFTVKETTQKEVEIKLPYYLSYNNSLFVKIISENECLLVTDGSISKQSISEHYIADTEYVECLAVEFNEVYERTMQIFNALKQQL